MLNETNPASAEEVTTYHETSIGPTLYRVTSVYQGKFELGKALEDLTVQKILRGEEIAARPDP